MSVATLIATYAENSRSHTSITERDRVFRLLKNAKQNLIALSVTYADNYSATGAGPGHLPCPNTDMPDGLREHDGPSPPCGNADVAVGRLPRVSTISAANRVLAYQKGYYNAEAALWYAVSNQFVNNPFIPVNSESEGKLSIDGEAGYVAVVSYPGNSIGTQLQYRPSLSIAHYLEGENSDGDYEFSRFAIGEGNDIIIGIKAEEMIPLVVSRILGNAVSWLENFRKQNCEMDYRLACYPAATETQGGACAVGILDGWMAVDKGTCPGTLFSDNLLDNVLTTSHWFLRNEWPRLIRYKVGESCLNDVSAVCEIVTGDVIFDGLHYPSITIVENSV